MKRIFGLICWLFLLNAFSQDDNLDYRLFSKDTLFILIEDNVAPSLNGRISVDATRPYPEDMSRLYSLDDDPLSFNNRYYTDLSLNVSFYKKELLSAFLKRPFISSDSLKNRPAKEVRNLMNGKVLMILDNTFCVDSTCYLVRVFQYVGEN